MRIPPGRRPLKVLLVEFNEITWRIADPLVARGRLPAFAEFIREGTRGAPEAIEVPPDLDPWISWTTLYTGRPQEEHGVRFLEQPGETVTGPRVWDVAADAGKSLGIYGSIMSWPPRRDVQGFWVPSTFSPGPETHPERLAPIQELNLGQTRAHTPLPDGRRRAGMLRLAPRLAGMGLRWTTAARVAASLLLWKVRPGRRWEKVGLQPLINLDFFERLYREHRPDLATFHSNHAAHYMHRYWRAMDPTPFLSPPPALEVRRYGRAIEYGYRVADRALRRLWSLADAGTVVIVASGLGQQPYVAGDFPEGRKVVRIRDIRKLIEICGVEGRCTPLAMMAPQWNLTIPDASDRAQAERVLRGAWVGSPGTRLYAFESAGDTLCVNVFQKNLKVFDPGAPCGFPDAEDRRLPLGDLCAAQDATPKEGCHDPISLALLRGPGIRRGAKLEACSNLDIAPTMLHLMNLPIPSTMKGRVLEEALEWPVSVPAPVAAPAVGGAAEVGA